ncbi:MAG: acyltransferase, partial [Desulfobacterales bacterium]|nr:acyltransferase [Desulfobacterales bacterium]
VLQRIFHRKIPFLKFFLKKELIWVPFLGLAWWALDFPFMKRYSKDFIDKYPHLKGKDIEITKKACEKFKTIPVSVMNFVEGTRFTAEKHRRQKSPYANLLNPKAGGVAFVLSAMGEHLDKIVNVTIVYPDGIKSFWDFLCGRIGEIKVMVETLPVNREIIGDYVNNAEFRENFQKWVNSVWEQKDMQIDAILKS